MNEIYKRIIRQNFDDGCKYYKNDQGKMWL